MLNTFRQFQEAQKCFSRVKYCAMLPAHKKSPLAASLFKISFINLAKEHFFFSERINNVCQRTRCFQVGVSILSNPSKKRDIETTSNRHQFDHFLDLPVLLGWGQDAASALAKRGWLKSGGVTSEYEIWNKMQSPSFLDSLETHGVRRKFILKIASWWRKRKNDWQYVWYGTGNVAGRREMSQKRVN